MVVVCAAVALAEPKVTEEALEIRAFAPNEIPWDQLAFWSDEQPRRDPPGRQNGPGGVAH